MIELPTDDDPVKVIQGDCLDVLRQLPDGCIDAVITDPPYGMNWNTNSKRFSGGKGYHNKTSSRIRGDNKPFNPSPWLGFQKVVLWGANHYAARLPVGTTLVWIKKSSAKFGAFLSDGEIGWMKGGHGVYAFWHVWDGCARESEHGEHYHPTQKPIDLMRWCIRKLRLQPGSLIIDPYAGSGTTGWAAIKEGHRCLLIEKEPAYCDIIRRRLSESGTLFAGV